MEPIPATYGRRQGTFLNETPAHHRALRKHLVPCSKVPWWCSKFKFQCFVFRAQNHKHSLPQEGFTSIHWPLNWLRKYLTPWCIFRCSHTEIWSSHPSGLAGPDLRLCVMNLWFWGSGVCWCIIEAPAVWAYRSRMENFCVRPHHEHYPKGRFYVALKVSWWWGEVLSTRGLELTTLQFSAQSPTESPQLPLYASMTKRNVHLKPHFPFSVWWWTICPLWQH